MRGLVRIGLILAKAPMATSASAAGTRSSSSSFPVGSRNCAGRCGTSDKTSASTICHCAWILKNDLRRRNQGMNKFATFPSQTHLCASVGRSASSGTGPASRPGGQICRRGRTRSGSPMTSFLSSVPISTPQKLLSFRAASFSLP